MVTEFSARTGGSKWVQALPAQRNQPLQLWRLVSCSSGGSRWQSALPTGQAAE